MQTLILCPSVRESKPASERTIIRLLLENNKAGQGKGAHAVVFGQGKDTVYNFFVLVVGPVDGFTAKANSGRFHYFDKKTWPINLTDPCGLRRKNFTG